MTGKYRKSPSQKSRFYLLLSIVFVIVMLKWGLPFFMTLVAGGGAVRQTDGDDIIPPQAPIIAGLPEATNSARITVEGFTEANAMVELMLNDQSYKIVQAQTDGSFSVDSVLIAGTNRIFLKAKDAANNESVSDVITIEYDNKPLNLTVLLPKDGSEYFGKLNQVVDVKGSVDKKNSSLIVNNSFVNIENDGSFLYRYMLSGGENSLVLSASDRAGNTSEKTIRVFYTP